VSDGTKQERLAQKSRRAALDLERVQQNEQRIADEERRHRDMVAKTTRLREQRLARDSAELKTIKNKAKPKPKGRRRDAQEKQEASKSVRRK
jgi:hypothetical protein